MVRCFIWHGCSISVVAFGCSRSWGGAQQIFVSPDLLVQMVVASISSFPAARLASQLPTTRSDPVRIEPQMATDSVYANSTHGTNLFTCTYVHSDTVRRCSESSMCGHVKFDNRYNLPYSVYTIHDMVHIFMICVYIRGCEYCTLSGMLLPECQAIMCVMHTCATYQSTASFRFPTESMQGARVCFT